MLLNIGKALFKGGKTLFKGVIATSDEKFVKDLAMDGYEYALFSEYYLLVILLTLLVIVNYSVFHAIKMDVRKSLFV